MAGKVVSAYKRLLLEHNTIFNYDKIGFKHFCSGIICHQASKRDVEFGLFFDIDGVLIRGGRLLPRSRETFKMLTNSESKFSVPTVFVTNAGNDLRQRKARQLSDWLQCKVEDEQVVMSHSPLKLFRQFWDKHVLVSGQGLVDQIAHNLGFTKVTTIEQMRNAFTRLDMVDHKRRKAAPCAFEKYFPRIEAVMLFGEPVRWETNLQLIIDVLLTNGRPSEAPTDIVYPHIPVLACNMDLMWMADAPMPRWPGLELNQNDPHISVLACNMDLICMVDAPMPRFAHGCFLHCLESLYHKISGYELKYTALVGKPSEITYHHSELLLQQQARRMGLPKLKRMYCIGDNPDADIYGANLYHKYIQSKLRKIKAQDKRRMLQSSSQESTVVDSSANCVANLDEFEEKEEEDEECLIHRADSRTYAIEEKYKDRVGVEECLSLLVCTGVFNQSRDLYSDSAVNTLLNHNHRDFLLDNDLKKPYYTAPNAYEAVKYVFQKEGLPIDSP